jgi:hypothetical protein
VAANQSHTLRVEFAATRFNVAFNGKPLFAVDDGTFPEAGMVAFGPKPIASPHSADSTTASNGRARRS